MFLASTVLLLATQAVLEDPGFVIASPLAANALQTAKLMKEYCQCEENKQEFDVFAMHLFRELENVLQRTSGSKQPRARREKMWGQYHLLRSSDQFRENWLGFLQCIPGCTPCPIFYQYVTDSVFKQLIKHHFPSCEQPQMTQQLPDLTHEESSALRYAAGYVCRAMQKEFKSKPEVLEAIDVILCRPTKSWSFKDHIFPLT